MSKIKENTVYYWNKINEIVNVNTSDFDEDEERIQSNIYQLFFLFIVMTNDS
jgi:hypothetical protein